MFIHFLMKPPNIIRNLIHQTEEIWQLIACFNHLNPWSSMKIPLESWFIMINTKSRQVNLSLNLHPCPFWCSNNFKPSVFHSFSRIPRIFHRIHVEASVFPCFPMVFPWFSQEKPMGKAGNGAAPPRGRAELFRRAERHQQRLGGPNIAQERPRCAFRGAIRKFSWDYLTINVD